MKTSMRPLWALLALAWLGGVAGRHLLGRFPEAYYDTLFSYDRFYYYLESYLLEHPELNIQRNAQGTFNRTQLEALADQLNIILVDPYRPQPYNNSYPAGAEGLIDPVFIHPYGIISGQPAPPGRFDYMVSLRVPPGGKHFCGGTLIADRVVLTAAHCFFDETSGELAREINNPDVAVGRYSRSEDANGSFVLKSVQTVVNPGFKFGRNFTNDAALVVLERPVPFPTVRLNSQEDLSQDSGVNATILGWGLVTTMGLAQVLREGQVPLVPRSQCQGVDAFKSLGAPITSTMLCAGQVQPANPNQIWPAIPPVDACQGDSGGPMIQPGANAGGDLQVGIVSFGIGCAKPGVPGVYTDVRAVLPFIESTLRLLSATPGNATAGPAPPTASDGGAPVARSGTGGG